MAPKASSKVVVAEPLFVKEDIEAIKADMKEKKEKVVDGQEFDIPVDGSDNVRTYRYEKKKYVYVGTVDSDGAAVSEDSSSSDVGSSSEPDSPVVDAPIAHSNVHKVDENGKRIVKEKRRSAYNDFISVELLKLKDEFPDKRPMERMPIAVERYHAWKATHDAPASDSEAVVTV